MALFCSRVLSRNFRNQLAVISRFYANHTESEKPNELATGVAKWQIEQIEAGNEDPFSLKAIKRHASSKSNPIIVHSHYEGRIIGCVCEEDSTCIIWMWLYKGEPRRCQCGHWFKLEEYKPV